MIGPRELQGLFGGLLGASFGDSRQQFYQSIMAQQQQNAFAITPLNQMFGPWPGTTLDSLYAARQYQNAFAERRRATIKDRILAVNDPTDVWLEESKGGETFYEWLDREGL